jgi:hypothetical protein
MSIPDTHVSITHFNSDAYHAWKGAFREVAKLTKELRINKSSEANIRRATWMLKQDTLAPFHQNVRSGANAGDQFAFNNDDISLINNNDWLHEQYKNSIPT